MNIISLKHESNNKNHFPLIIYIFNWIFSLSRIHNEIFDNEKLITDCNLNL